MQKKHLWNGKYTIKYYFVCGAGNIKSRFRWTIRERGHRRRRLSNCIAYNSLSTHISIFDSAGAQKSVWKYSKLKWQKKKKTNEIQICCFAANIILYAVESWNWTTELNRMILRTKKKKTYSLVKLAQHSEWMQN